MKDFTTDVDGKPVHPAVTEMAEELAELNNAHLVLINWWKEGRIQYWNTRAHVPSEFYELVEESGWRVSITETRVEEDTERGYAEIVPKNFDPAEFSNAPK